MTVLTTEATFQRRIKRALTVQMVIAILVTALSLVAAFKVAPLVKQYKQMEQNLAVTRDQLAEAEKEKGTAEQELKLLKQHLDASREMMGFVNSGINSYHQRLYDRSLYYFDQALAADPQNAYVLNLKGDTLLRMHRFQEAIEAQNSAIAADPNYPWAYLDLARGLCAVDDYQGATRALSKGIALRNNLRMTAASDITFRRQCAPVVTALKLPRVPKSQQSQYLLTHTDRFLGVAPEQAPTASSSASKHRNSVSRRH